MKRVEVTDKHVFMMHLQEELRKGNDRVMAMTGLRISGPLSRNYIRKATLSATPEKLCEILSINTRRVRSLLEEGHFIPGVRLVEGKK